MTEPHNRVVQVSRCGDPEALQVVNAPLPTAGRGEVRVRVLASSLNYTEVLIRRHLYPQTMRLRPPFVMGYDVVGEIDQIGDGVRDFQIGDRVADMTVVGSNADYRTLRAGDLARVSVAVDAAEAATLILSWTTAYQLLHRAARVQRGQCVLVHGAAGAVGQALLVLGRLAGLELWGTARGEHTALVRELGATPIYYQREDFTRVLPGGFDVIVDGMAKTAIAARMRRSSAAASPSASRRAYRHSVACSLSSWRLRASTCGGYCPAVSVLAFTRLMRCGREIPPGSRRIWSSSSAYWQLAPSGRASPIGFPLTRSPRLTAASRRAASWASSSCARNSRTTRSRAASA